MKKEGLFKRLNGWFFFRYREYRFKRFNASQQKDSKTGVGVKSLLILLLLAFGLLLFTKNANAQIKHKNSVTIATGMYSASGFGTNPYYGLRYNHYLNQGKYFFEGSFGVSSLQSDVLKTLGNTHFFKSNELLVYEFLFGYDPKMWTSLPYFTIGMAGLNQGGQSKYTTVIGIGNRLYFDTLFGSKNIGLRYDLRDHIVKQSFNDKDSFISNNLVFTLNLEFFF